MIRVKFVMDESRKMLTFKEKGHAGMASVGNDIVCASASMLAYTLAQNVRYEESAGNLKYRPTVKLNKGNANIAVRAKTDDDYIRLCHLFCVIQTGYQLLAHNYPQFVDVTLFGEEDHSGI